MRLFKFSVQKFHVAVLSMVIIFFCSISNAFTQYYEKSLSFESGTELLYGQSARTLKKGHYTLELQGLSIMQREKFIVIGGNYNTQKDNPTIVGVPVTIGITDHLNLLTGLYFFNDVRPYKNESDIYQYYDASERGLGAFRLGLKLKASFNPADRFQIAGKCVGVFHTSDKNH